MYKIKENLDITMNYANPGDHVPDKERNKISFKEIYRAQYYIIIFHNIPKVMIRYLDFEVLR